MKGSNVGRSTNVTVLALLFFLGVGPSVAAEIALPPPGTINEGEDHAFTAATFTFTLREQAHEQIYVTVTPDPNGSLSEIRIAFRNESVTIGRDQLTGIEWPDLLQLRITFAAWSDGNEVMELYFPYRQKGCVIARGVCRLVKFGWHIGQNSVSRTAHEFNESYD